MNYFEDSLEIVYDASQGVSGLMGATKVYFHSAAELVPFGGWQYAVGNWGQDDGVGEMQSLGNNLWRIHILPHNYYGYASGSTPNGLFMVFRNADGSATGKDDNNADIWVDMAQDPPFSAFSGVQLVWKRDAIDSMVWNDGSMGSTLAVAGSGTYWLQVTDTSGCMATDTIVVGLGSLPIVNIQDAAICDGQPAVLDAGIGFTSYQWSNGATTQSTTVNSPGNYFVTVTNSAGCTAVDVITVASLSAPNALFNASVNFMQVQFVDGSTLGSSYRWDFDGDGDTDATTPGTTSFAYNLPGTYQVQLIVSNACGIDTFVQAVTVGGVGVEQENNLGDYVLWPNPTSTGVTIKLELGRPTELEWIFCDAQGRELYRGQEGRQVGTWTRNWNLQHLPTGLYQLLLRGENGVKAISIARIN